MWRKYKELAVAIGVHVRDGQSFQDAVETVQQQFDAAPTHKAFLRGLKSGVSDVEAIAKEVLGY